MIAKRERQIQAYCADPIENIENYEQARSDTETVWDCHHRLEIQGDVRHTPRELIACGRYYHVPASELVFLPHTEHMRIHHNGAKRTDKTRRRISASMVGNKNFANHTHTAETREKISMKRMGFRFSEDAKKKMSDAKKGRRLSAETRMKMRLAQKLRREKERRINENETA